MLSGAYRFHSRGGVRYTYKNGRQVRGVKISLVVADNMKRRKGRFAVIVSKKVLKSAVKRNRMRRRVYEVIRAELPRLAEAKDVLVNIYSKDVVDMEHKELVGLMKQSFSDAGLYANGGTIMMEVE